MEIRKAKVEEYEDIKIIYLRAREFMVSEGNLTQWANIDQILNKVLKDIRAGHCYVCTENDVLLGVFCFFIGEELTYNKIYNGEWLNDKPYGFIHRIAVAVYQKGVVIVEQFIVFLCFFPYVHFSNFRIHYSGNVINSKKSVD